MENRAHALAAGIFVVVVAALLVALAGWLTRDTGERDLYEISTRQTITGLQSQAPVRYRGVDVGKVTSIGFDPKAEGNVLLSLEIDRGAPLNRETFASLGLQGITGLAFVQLDDSGKPAPRLVPDDEHPPRIPLRPSLLERLTAHGEAILDRVDQVTVRMNQLLGDDNQKRVATVLDGLSTTAATANRLTQHLDETVTRRIDPALTEAASTLSSVRQSADEVDKTSAEFRRTAQRLNAKDGPMDRLAEGAEALSHAADSFNAATLPRINRVAEETSRAVRQLGRAVNTVNDNPQALIFGAGAAVPGPGEPGFDASGAAK
jgi:phospholipid/cholesterol/gamma-HCH transport system substrate-binding protein